MKNLKLALMRELKKRIARRHSSTQREIRNFVDGYAFAVGAQIVLEPADWRELGYDSK